MNDLTRALCHRIQRYRKWGNRYQHYHQVEWRTNRQRVASLSHALGFAGNRDANWDILITRVLEMRVQLRDAREKVRNAKFETRADKNELTMRDMAFLVENGWTPPPGTPHIPCLSWAYDCFHPDGAGHDGDHVAAY